MERQTKILAIEADRAYGEIIRQAFSSAGESDFALRRTESWAEGLRVLTSELFDLVLADLKAPGCPGLPGIATIRSSSPGAVVLILVHAGEEHAGVAAVRHGAQDYVVRGHIDGLMLARMARSVLERRAVEQALREREEFFRLISENVTDLIAVLDRDGKRLYNSPSYRNILGDPTSIRGTDSFIEIHPDDRERVRRIFEQTVATGLGQRTEYRFLVGEGSIRYMESVGSVIGDAAGKPSKVVVVSRDITEHRLAMERLRQSEALYHSLVESLPQFIFRKDLQGRFIFVNHRFAEAVRRSFQEIIGLTDADLFPGDLAEKYRRDDEAVMEAGQILETVEEHELPQGGRIDVHVVKIPIRDGAGRITGIQGIYWDITKQKQAEESLRTALADLKRSHEDLKSAQLQLIQAAKLESVGTLAAGVAHEVKNPLQTILMGLHYLETNLAAPDENSTMVLGEMRAAVKRADEIVRGLLHFAAAQQSDMREEDLNVVVAQSLLLVKYELTRGQIQLETELAPELPRVRLDKAKMEQVFINLFVNAIHAMEGGGTLSVRTAYDPMAEVPRGAPFRAGDGVVVVEVSDTGKGIAPEHLSKIFDPFFTTKPTGVGTGLGLPVTKKIIELHGGHIELRNRPEHGVLVRVSLKP